MRSLNLANLPVQREPSRMSKFEMPAWNRARHIKSIEPTMPTPAIEPGSYVEDISAEEALAEPEECDAHPAKDDAGSD